MDLTGRTALVTGASRGLGRQIAIGLARAGANVVGTFLRHQEGAEETVSQIQDLGGVAAAVRADVTSEEQMAGAVRHVVENFGTLDVLVNNAGISIDGVSWKLSLADWTAVIATNLTGPFLGSKHAIPVMRSAGFGRIINIGSIVGQIGVPGTVAYASAKAGLFGLTRAIAAEVAGRGVTVNALALGYFDGGLFDDLPPDVRAAVIEHVPMERPGAMDELQAVVNFLASPAAGYVTGTIIDVNGGYR